MPLVIYLPNTEYGYTKTIYSFVYLSFVLLFWVLESVLKKRFDFSLTKLAAPFSIVLVAGLFSLINASSAGVVLQSLGLLVYFFVFYLLVANTVEDRGDAELLVVSLVVAALGAGLYGFLQYLGLVAGAEGLQAGATNIISTMGNQNYLGGFLSYLFLPAFVFFLISDLKVLRFFILSVLGLSFFILFPIGSRGAWLSLVIGVICFGFGIAYFKLVEVFRDRKTWIVLFLVLLVLVYLIVAAPGPLNTVLAFPSSEQGNSGGFLGFLSQVIQPLRRELVEQGGARIEDWLIGWKMVQEHPGFGIGLGHYKIHFLDYRAKLLQSEMGESFGGYIPRGAQAHNEYMQLLAEIGFVGMGALSLAFLTVILFSWRRISSTSDKYDRLIGLSFLASIFGFFAHSAVSFPLHLPASVLVFSLGLGILHSSIYGRPGMRITLGKVKTYLVVFLILVFSISVSVLAYQDWRANILRGKGVTQMKYGNYRVARGYLLDSIAKDFRPRHTYFYLGVVERQLGNPEQALQYFEKCQPHFNPYKLQLHLGTLYMQLGKLEQAEQTLTKFIHMGPEKADRLEARYFLASLALRRDNYSEARRRVDQILEENPDFHRARILLGDLHYAREEFTKAKQNWQQALELIENKVDQIKRNLSGNLSLDRYNRLRSERESLKQQKKGVQEKLDKLEY